MHTGLPFIVVVAEADAETRFALRRLLQDSGYAVLHTGTAEEAGALLREYPWDLAILDNELQRMGVVSLAEELKANPELESRYVLVVVNNGDEQEKITALDHGADDYLTRPIATAELLAKIRSAKRMMELSKKLIRLNKQLEVLSITDDLTGLYNRRYFIDQLTRSFEQGIRYSRPLSLILLDIDRFKAVNDGHGHAAGDRVLEEISTILAQTARSTDLVCRFGGDEFAVTAPETPSEDALLFSERILTNVNAAGLRAGAPTPGSADEAAVTVSIGIASLPDSEVQTVAQLMEQADRALYRAKGSGRNQVCRAVSGQVSDP